MENLPDLNVPNVVDIGNVASLNEWLEKTEAKLKELGYEKTLGSMCDGFYDNENFSYLLKYPDGLLNAKILFFIDTCLNKATAVYQVVRNNGEVYCEPRLNTSSFSLYSIFKESNSFLFLLSKFDL